MKRHVQFRTRDRLGEGGHMEAASRKDRVGRMGMGTVLLPERWGYVKLSGCFHDNALDENPEPGNL